MKLHGARKLWLVLLVLVPLLTSCVKMNVDLTINKDATISGSAIFAVSDSLAALSESKTSFTPDNFVDLKSKGVTVSEYREGGFTGSKLTFDHAPTTIFDNSSSKDSSTQQSFSVKRVGSQYHITGLLDLSSSDLTGSSDPSNPLGDSLTKALFASADLRFTVTFPGKVVSSNGTINAEKNSITWYPKIGEKNEFDATIDVGVAQLMPYILGGVGGLAAILAVIIFLVSRRRKNSTPQEKPQE